MSEIKSISTDVSLNQNFGAAVCMIEAQYPGEGNKFLLNIVRGEPFVQSFEIQSFWDQYGNVNLMIPQPGMAQTLWVSMTFAEFSRMIFALLQSAQFKNEKHGERIKELLALIQE